MSTIAYAWATSRAEQNALLARVTDADEQPDTSKASELAQKIAALVPAEVIAAWAAVLAKTTEKAADGSTVLKIDGASTQKTVLLVLAGLSLVFYVVTKVAKPPHHFAGLDWVRMLVPPISFVVWTELTGSTALGLWKPFSNINELTLWGGALVVGLLLLLLQSTLTPKTDKRASIAAAEAQVVRLRAA
jgi:hypothetical protein